MIEISLTPKSFYKENISQVREEIHKLKPYRDEFIETYHPNAVGRHKEQLKMQLNNYLNGNSYLSGLELGWNQKIIEFINRKINEKIEQNNG